MKIRGTLDDHWFRDNYHEKQKTLSPNIESDKYAKRLGAV